MPEEKRMGFLEHLEEVRSRLIVSIIAILVTTTLAYVFSDAILHILLSPAAAELKARGITNGLVAFSPMDGFMIRFRVALYGGLVLAAPVWIFEVIRFIEPGLMPHEKRWFLPGVFATILLFLIGNLFGFMMLSNMMTVLFAMFGSELNYLPSADQYISFVVYFLVATGIAFELPIILLVFMRLGLVSPEALKKQRRVAYFIIFVFAEFITPVADPIVAPMVVMVPMIGLFELALFMSKFVVPKPKAAALPASGSATK